MKRKALLVILGMSLGMACTPPDDLGSDLDVDQTEQALVQAHAVVDESADATGVRYWVNRCGDTEALFEKTHTLEDQLVPGNMAELHATPLDQTSEHKFADYFQVLEPGCYDVHAQPITEDGADSETCAAAWKSGIEIHEGETTEVFLIIQCEGEDKGALDAIAAFNNEPQLEDVVFEDSKFVCGGSAHICLFGSDVDHDPLEFELVAHDDRCDIAPVQPEQAPAGDMAQACYEVTCHDWGRFDLTARVYDLVWRDGEKIRIEQWLELEGYPNESHSELDFFAYFDGVKYYPDKDGDTFGDKNAPPTLVCEGDEPLVGFVKNNSDCNDTDSSINPEAPELCDDIDNDCDEKIDEDFGDLGSRCEVMPKTGCYAEGQIVCNDSGTDTECNAVPGQPKPEICDGIDNDCDSEIDEDLDFSRDIFEDEGDGDCCDPAPDYCQGDAPIQGGHFEITGRSEICVDVRTTVNGQTACHPQYPVTETQGYEQFEFYLVHRQSGDTIDFGTSDDCNGNRNTCDICGPYRWCVTVTAPGDYDIVARHIDAGQGCQSAGLRRGDLHATCQYGAAI